VNFDPHVLYAPIKDSIEAQGIVHSAFASQFEQIQKAFVYLNMALGAVGLLALFTASLGIVNTMVMSISSEEREIVYLSRSEADQGEIRALFLAESGVIGFMRCRSAYSRVGPTRIVSFVAIFTCAGRVCRKRTFCLPYGSLLALSVGVGVAVSARALSGYARRKSQISVEH